MALLAQFLLRLTFGLAVGMAVTSPRLVTSGYFRNHLYVTLGLSTFAALVAMGTSTVVAALSALTAVLSYLGSVCWLYESKRAGVIFLWLVAATALAGALIGEGGGPLQAASVVTSGLVLGLTFAAMLLGHWYLNVPGMELAPLRRLLVLMAIAVVGQMIITAIGLVGAAQTTTQPAVSWWLFVVLRWSFGLLGVLGLVWMAWETLKIPNTQSATGILYVAVIGVFVGELTGLLLSAESSFPL